MSTTLQKWGNSLAVRIPKDLADQLELTQGQAVRLSQRGQELLIRRVPPQKKHSTKDSWRAFVIPTNRKPENVSGNIDTILYETSAR